VDEGTLARWLARKHTSTHGIVPGQWTQTWNAKATLHSENLSDYEMTSMGTTYTTDALQAFLRFAPTHQDGEIWPEEELKQAGEYIGVSAFDNPKDALNYGSGPLAAVYWYVEFAGDKLFALKPEESEGGWTVSVLRELHPPVMRDAFIRRLS
jgi:hypothetical protein